MVPVTRFFRVKRALLFSVNTAGPINLSRYSITKISVGCLMVDEPVYVGVYFVWQDLV